MIQRTFRIAELDVQNENQRLYDAESFNNLPASCPIVFGTDMNNCVLELDKYMKYFTQIGVASNFKIDGGFLVADIEIPDGTLFAKATPEEFDSQFVIVPSGFGEEKYVRDDCSEYEFTKAEDPTTEVLFNKKTLEDALADDPTAETRVELPDEISDDLDFHADEKIDDEKAITIDDRIHGIKNHRVIRGYNLLVLTIIDKKNSSFVRFRTESTLV